MRMVLQYAWRTLPSLAATLYELSGDLLQWFCGVRTLRVKWWRIAAFPPSTISK